MKNLLFISACFFCAASSISCVSRTLMLDAPLVSMTKGPKAKGGYKIGKEVTSKYCSGDTVTSTQDSTAGMIDEVVFRAQQSSKASYIAEVSIYEVQKFFSGPCYELKGKAAN